MTKQQALEEINHTGLKGWYDPHTCDYVVGKPGTSTYFHSPDADVAVAAAYTLSGTRMDTRSALNHLIANMPCKTPRDRAAVHTLRMIVQQRGMEGNEMCPEEDHLCEVIDVVMFG